MNYLFHHHICSRNYKQFLKVIVLFLAIIIFSSPAYSDEDENIDNTESKHWYDAVSASLEFDNISYTTLNEEFKTDAELEIANADKEKYLLGFKLDYTYDEDKDSYTKARVVDETFSSELDFKLNDFFHDHFDYTSMYKYGYERETSDKTKRDDVEISPLGLTINFYKSSIFKEISVSYLPQYNFHKYYYIDEDNNASTDKKTERSLRHVGVFDICINLFDDKITLENKFTLKKTQAYDPIDKDTDDYPDLIMMDEFDIKFNINDIFSIGYGYKYENDKRRERIHNQPCIEKSHCLTFTFSWNT